MDDRFEKTRSHLIGKAAIVLKNYDVDENATIQCKGDTDSQLILSQQPTQTFRGDRLSEMQNVAAWYIRFRSTGEYMKFGSMINLGQPIISLGTHEATDDYSTRYVNKTNTKIPLLYIECSVLFYAYSLNQKVAREQ